MTNAKILEMINNNQIEELKKQLADEIYNDSLKGNGDAKKRYSAMKRYFKWVEYDKYCCQYPCKDIEIDGKLYNSFMDGYSLVLTTEDIGEMECFDKTKGDYFKVENIINFIGTTQETVNIGNVLAKAKSKGYKFKKTELTKDNVYMFKYKEAYFKIGLLDKAFGIIDNGEDMEVYYKGSMSALIMKNSIGICVVMPMAIYKVNGNKITIEA